MPGNNLKQYVLGCFGKLQLPLFAICHFIQQKTNSNFNSEINLHMTPVLRMIEHCKMICGAD